MFVEDRIRIEPLPAVHGKNVTITYRGFLAASAAEVYLHYGYDGWINPQDVKMIRKEDGSFQVQLPAKGKREINFCFKDGAAHWDNNNGNDWLCLIL